MNLRTTLLVAAASVVGFTGVASAQFVIYGGGATLPAPYFRQAADCYGADTSLAFRNTATTTDLIDFIYTGSPNFNCGTTTVQPNVRISYIGTGSGRGILGFFTSDAANAPADWNGSTAPVSITPPGLNYEAEVQFAISETAIAQAPVLNGSGQVTVPGVNTYNNGGAINTAGTTVAPPNGAGDFPNPLNTYGPMIQIPLLVAPITVAFDQTYKKVADAQGNVTSFEFRYPGKRADGSGGLDIDRATFCGIFNGTITNWNQIPGVGRQTSPNVDPDPNFSVPLQIVGRLDSSGTTSGWTRHLAAACGGAYTNSTPTLPVSLIGATYNKTLPNFPPAPGETLGKYTIAEGNDGVAQYVDFTAVPAPGQTLIQGRMGYLGSDFVLPYVLNTGANNFNLATADLQNASGAFRDANSRSVELAFRGINPPDSDTQGNYIPAAPGDRANPAAGAGDGFWVQVSDVSSPISDPSNSGAYPIVTTSNALIYTCYSTAAEVSAVRGFFEWYLTNDVVTDRVRGILTAAGFTAPPTAYRNAAVQTFFSPTGATSGLNLRIIQGNTGVQCAGRPGA